jgi:hypothetical protein
VKRALILLAAAVGLTALAGPATAAEPGFFRSSMLSDPAFYVAGWNVPVYCTYDSVAWSRVRSVYRRADAGGLYTYAGGRGRIYLAPKVCSIVLGLMRGERIWPWGALDRSDAALTLVHVFFHARGVVNQGRTECEALRRLPGVAVRYLNVKPGNDLRAFIAAAWKAHRLKPAAYTSVC